LERAGHRGRVGVFFLRRQAHRSLPWGAKPHRLRPPPALEAAGRRGTCLTGTAMIVMFGSVLVRAGPVGPS